MHKQVLIIFPPQWTPVSPYSALPLLCAELKSSGIAAESLDLNCAAYDLLLTEDYLRALRLPETFASADPRYPMRWLLSFRGELASKVAEAKRIMRSGSAFFDRRQYLWAENTLRYALLLVSLSFWPQQVGLDSLDLGIPSARLFGEAQLDRPFGDFLFEDALEAILGRAPIDRYAVVGFSVHTSSQLFYSLRVIRRCLRDGHNLPHTVIGGTLLSSLHRYSATFQPIFNAGVDTIVYARGRESFLNVCRHVTAGIDSRACPGILYSDTQSVCKNPPANVKGKLAVDLDYDGLALDRYLSPAPLLNIPSSTGCYWGKCRFCNYRDTYAVVEPARLSWLMEKLGERHNTHYFFLAQSTLNYEQALSLPACPGHSRNHTWGSLARIDEHAKAESVAGLYAAGCRKLSFGLETRSPALRDKMHKGPLAEDIDSFLHSCHRQGIGLELFFIAGYPGETIRDVERTLDFIRRLLPHIDTLSANQFSLVCNSAAFQLMLHRDEFLLDRGPLTFSEILDQHRLWTYRDRRRADRHDQRTAVFWQGLTAIVEESPTHLWRTNTAFRSALPRLPEHQFLYLATPQRVTGAGAVAAAQKKLAPVVAGGQTLLADLDSMTFAYGRQET